MGTDKRYTQRRIIESGSADSNPLPENGHSSFCDPAFAVNKTTPVHRWVPWIAGFSRDFVRDAIQEYLPRDGRVLDPFSGVGTTLLEAAFRGVPSIGFEINHYAAFASRVKVDAYRILPESLQAEIDLFRVSCRESKNEKRAPTSIPPKGFKTRTEFYSPKVLRKVLLFQDFVETVGDQDIRDLFRLAFAATMVQYSNYSYEPSLSTRSSVGKRPVDDSPVHEIIADKLSQMLRDIVWYRERIGDRCCPEVRVINDSFFRCADYLEPKSVDLVITSPPYLNNYHYNRNTRPQLYWLGFIKDPGDMKPLEMDNYGNYWQTVREGKQIDLTFSLPETDLTGLIEEIRRKNPGRGIYGGNGWANYAASYFNDCYRFSKSLAYVLRKGGTALVVIGNSIIQGTTINTDKYFGAIAQEAGLELVRIEVPRFSRVGNSIIQSNVRIGKADKNHRLYEAVVELRNE